jgi:energy-coupling factor transporter ATP-binding protein EcfA2
MKEKTMKNRIQSIKLKNFRGATAPLEINFDTNKSITMIFGENGTGKSTIVDGIDFVCNEEFGSLNQRSISQKKVKLIASLGESEKNLEVSLKYKNQTWQGKIGSGNRPNANGPQNRPKAHILRRSQILKIIDTKPSERYNAVKTYIEVPYCEKNEESLRDAVKNVNSQYNDAVKAVQQAEDNLKYLWESENEPGTSYMEWANEKLKENHDILEANVKNLEILLNLYSNCGTLYKGFLDLKDQLKDDEKKRDDAKEVFIKNQLKVVEASGTYIDILNTAKLYFQQNVNAQNCPVCENEINAGKVLKRIDERMENIKEQIRLKNEYENAQKQVDLIINQLQSSEKHFIDKVKELLKHFYEKSISNFIQPVNRETIPFWQEYSIEDFSAISIEKAVEICKEIKSHKEELEVKKKAVNKTFSQLNAIRIFVDNIKTNKVLCKALEKKLKKLDALKEIVEKERKSFVESILADISETVEEIYAKIHPDEGYGKINFYLNPKTRGSLEFTGQFQHVTDIIPQAYFSESHLDTLGICVFLALAKRYLDEDTIIVMDDVVTSVDQVHIERFMRMISDEVSEFNQVILTTHYRPWRDRYRYARGASAEIQLIELLPWSFSRGIRHTKTKIIVDDLIEKCSEVILDRQSVASKAGVILESLLDFLTFRYRCLMPRKTETDYTLAELLNGLDKKLKLLLKIEKYKDDGSKNEVDLAPLLLDIDGQTWIRNQVGAHFSITGMDISNEDVKTMGELSLKFAQALICEECGQLPDRNKSGSYWECKCGKARLHPLSIPG